MPTGRTVGRGLLWVVQPCPPANGTANRRSAGPTGGPPGRDHRANSADHGRRAGRAAQEPRRCAGASDEFAGQRREGAAAPERRRGRPRYAARQRRGHPGRCLPNSRPVAARAGAGAHPDREARPAAGQGWPHRIACHCRRACAPNRARLVAGRRRQVDRVDLGTSASADRTHHRDAACYFHQEPDGAPAKPVVARSLAGPHQRNPRCRSPLQLPGRRLAALGGTKAPAAFFAVRRRHLAVHRAVASDAPAHRSSRHRPGRTGALLLRACESGRLGGAAARARHRCRRPAALWRARRAGPPLSALGARGGRHPQGRRHLLRRLGAHHRRAGAERAAMAPGGARRRFRTAELPGC